MVINYFYAAYETGLHTRSSVQLGAPRIEHSLVKQQ